MRVTTRRAPITSLESFGGSRTGNPEVASFQRNGCLPAIDWPALTE